MSDPEIRALFARGMEMARRVSSRLDRSVERLSGVFPLDGARIDALEPADQEAVDAFLKRFEQLVDLIDHRLLRGLALLEGEDVQDQTKRDVTLLMARIGVVDDADAWSMCSTLRNKLAHDYPDAPERRAERLNEAFAHARRLPPLLDRIEARAAGSVSSR